MKYSIVIPTYNNCEKYLKPCVDSLIKYTDMSNIELIISANGCNDNTKDYLNYLATSIPNLKIVWNNKPLGYSKSINEGIKICTNEYIILLNNDVIFLNQEKNFWLQLFDKSFQNNLNCGISCVVKSYSEPANHNFAIFFCVMIHQKVFKSIGLLNEEYGVGGGEDTEFCIEAEKNGFEIIEATKKEWNGTQWVSIFPIYHKGEGTMHDPELVQEWDNIFLRNSLKLAKKYNFDWYRWRLSNYWERAVFLKGDGVYPREVTRYNYAKENLIGKKILEIGCSSGYGIQFFPQDIDYTGVDYDPIIVEVATEQGWNANAKFVNADINKFPMEDYDTIVAFEVIEHLANGLEIVEMLKNHCKRLLITVPMNEPFGFWGPHHKLHGLNESHFPDFKFHYINEQGEISDEPQQITQTNSCNLMICRWDA